MMIRDSGLLFWVTLYIHRKMSLPNKQCYAFKRFLNI